MTLSGIVFYLFLFFEFYQTEATVTDKQYASMPEVFHFDNYDKCMLLGDEAFYCVFQYELLPADEGKPPEVWKIVKEVSSNPDNYRHDHLRHGICVPTACPNITKTDENDPKLWEAINECYDKRYADIGLKGKITEMRCLTNKSKYPIDTYDITVAVVLVSYLIFVILASFYEGLARYKSKEQYERITGTKFGKLMVAFSVPRNWIRLKTITSSPDVERLKCIQGIRFYNMLLVIMVHTAMTFVGSPVVNTKFAETTKEKFLNLFLSNNGFAVQTFFLLAAWMLSYNYFLMFEGKKEVGLRFYILAFINRYIRLTPALAVVIALHSTWLVHLNDGPMWDEWIGKEYRNCRKNGWSNLLYLNNYVDPSHMCLMQTWYLGVDTQFFILSLILLHFMRKYENKIPHILGSVYAIHVLLLFSVNYYNDYTGAQMPEPEKVYLGRIVQDYHWHYILGAPYSNLCGLVAGLAVGYLYYKYREQKLFNTKFRVFFWWTISFGISLGVLILPGSLIYNDLSVRNRFWASVYVGTGRGFFAFAMAFAFFGITQGIGWMAKWTLEWAPTYVLGRLTYSAFLVHCAIAILRPALIRSPMFISDHIVMAEVFSDIFLSFMCGTIFTLLFEMPMSELQKLIIPAKGSKSGGKKEEKKQK